MDPLPDRITRNGLLVDAFIPQRRDGDRSLHRRDTLIRHAAVPLTFPVCVLMVTVVESAFSALLMFAVGLA